VKNLLYGTIVKDKNFTFIFTDTQIISENLVEDLNCLLNSGSVFGLPYNPEEIKELEEVSKKICQRKNLIPNKINVLNE